MRSAVFLGYHSVYGGTTLPTFWYNLLVPSSRVKKYKIWQADCPETSVKNYQFTLRNIPEKLRSRESSCSYIVTKNSNLTYANLNDTSGRNRHCSSHLSESKLIYIWVRALVSVYKYPFPQLAFGELFRTTLLTMHFSHRDTTYRLVVG